MDPQYQARAFWRADRTELPLATRPGHPRLATDGPRRSRQAVEVSPIPTATANYAPSPTASPPPSPAAAAIQLAWVDPVSLVVAGGVPAARGHLGAETAIPGCGCTRSRANGRCHRTDFAALTGTDPRRRRTAPSPSPSSPAGTAVSSSSIRHTIDSKTVATAYAHMWRRHPRPSRRPGERRATHRRCRLLGHEHRRIICTSRSGRRHERRRPSTPPPGSTSTGAANLPTATSGSPAACNNATAGTRPVSMETRPACRRSHQLGQDHRPHLHLYQQTRRVPRHRLGLLPPPRHQVRASLGRACDITFGNRIGQRPNPSAARRRLVGHQLDEGQRRRARRQYLIWQEIWSVARDADGWRPYNGGGGVRPASPSPEATTTTSTSPSRQTSTITLDVIRDGWNRAYSLVRQGYPVTDLSLEPALTRNARVLQVDAFTLRKTAAQDADGNRAGSVTVCCGRAAIIGVAASGGAGLR